MSTQYIIESDTKKTFCEICKTYHPSNNFFYHIKKHDLSSKEYYDKFYKEEAEEKCNNKNCNNDTRFDSLVKGYGYLCYCSRDCQSNDKELHKRNAEKTKKVYGKGTKKRKEAIKKGLETKAKIPNFYEDVNKKRLKTLDDNPEIMINAGRKTSKTLADNPEIGEKRNQKRKKTLDGNPEILKKAKEKEMQTKRDNPEIMKEAGRKISKTLRDNPEISKNRAIKQMETKNGNPEIMKVAEEKRLKTLKDNPEILVENGKKIAIAKREYYNKIQESDSTIPFYLYIIKHLTKPIIKIGKSGIPEKRLRQINTSFGDSEIVMLHQKNYKEISNLEIHLHDYFKEHCKVQPKGDGRTEWFDECILEEALSMVS